MPRQLRLRPVSAVEEKHIRRLASSRTQPARLVQRARVIQVLLDDPSISAKEAGFLAGYKSEACGRRWTNRFNEGGIEALEDRPRSGRPVVHDEIVRSKLLGLALQKPSGLGYPFALWTLERLQAAFEEREGIRLATSAIWGYVKNEGLKWKRQESWFRNAAKHDPDFAEKRGPLSQPTSIHRRLRA